MIYYFVTRRDTEKGTCGGCGGGDEDDSDGGGVTGGKGGLDMNFLKPKGGGMKGCQEPEGSGN